MLDACWTYLGLLWDRVRKVVLHWWTGKCEIERICAPAALTTAHRFWATQFARSLYRSKQLSTYSKIIFYPKLFSVGAACQNLCDVKRIPINEPLRRRITQALHALRYVNAIAAQLDKAQKTAVDSKSDVQHAALLAQLWANLRPGVSRVADADWGEIGFQGRDPDTDFRGLGLLGLQQLVHFSGGARADAARHVLVVSNHPRRFFPFAATGINVSAFVLELLRGRHLHQLFFQRLGDDDGAEGGNRDGDGPSGSDVLVARGVEAVHGVYADVYERFCALWEARDPPNVMAFRGIFAEVQAEFRRKYPAL